MKSKRRYPITCNHCSFSENPVKGVCDHNKFFYWDDKTRLSDVTKAGLTLELLPKKKRK